MSDDDHVLFTERYGISYFADAPEWARRHKPGDADGRHRCRCPGPSTSEAPCRQSCTEEDLLCNQCRKWCICVDQGGKLHLIADRMPT